MFGAKKWFVGVDGSAIVEIRDVEAARRRYAEKLRLTYSAEENEPEWAGFSLGYSAEEIHICWCGCQEKSTPPTRPPILFTRKVSAAHDLLSSPGIVVGPLQQDVRRKSIFPIQGFRRKRSGNLPGTVGWTTPHRKSRPSRYLLR